MSSKSVKVSTNGGRVFVDPKTKLVTKCNAQVVGPTNKSLNVRPLLNKLRKRKRANECDNKCSRKTFLKNYSNFMKSGLPQRVLFSQDGQWVDFTQEVINLVKEGFQSKRAAIEVKSNACHFMLDVLHMIQVDLKTGAQKPIAWIDEAGNCIFPELYSSCHGNHDDLDLGEPSNTPEINLQLEIALNGLDNTKVEECVGESNVKRVKVDQELSNNIHTLPFEENQTSDKYASPVYKITCGTVDVETARNMFTACLGSDLKVDFLEVKKYSSSHMEEQYELFQKQVEITQKLRGKANVQYGWFAASGDEPSAVMFYGPNGPKLGTYGYGVHLAAVQSPQFSTMLCDDDEKEIKHMVLCRVILGNVEVVHAGCKQFHPSDQCFDNGVDDLQNPNYYVVWNMNMNTHIFPECVISFKISPTTKGNQHRPLNQDSSSNQTGKNNPQFEVINLPSHEKVGSITPKSSWMPFSKLLEAISAKVSPNDMTSLKTSYELLNAKKIKREEFVRKLRSVVGDQILRSTITVFQTKDS